LVHREFKVHREFRVHRELVLKVHRDPKDYLDLKVHKV